MRTASGSFGQGNARLATLGNAIASRNVCTLPNKHQRYNSTLRVGRHAPLREASEAIRVARPQTKPRTAQRPSREGAFGAPLFSNVSATVVRFRMERSRPWRAPRRRGVGASRGLRRNPRTRTQVPNAKVGDRVRATLRVAVYRRGGKAV